MPELYEARNSQDSQDECEHNLEALCDKQQPSLVHPVGNAATTSENIKNGEAWPTRLSQEQCLSFA
jgi:hypothetical protein